MAIYSKIVGVGSYVPPNVVTNFDLEKRLDTSDEWIQQRTGIKKRHWVDPETSNSDLALEATHKALAQAGLSKEDIDLIVYATLSPDADFPGSGVFLQHKLALSGIPAIDIRQQCSGFLYGLSIVDSYIRSGSYKNILLVGSEIHMKGMDKTPRGRDVAVLFGDGAGVCVLTACDVKDPKKDSHIIDVHLHADGEYADQLWVQYPGSANPSEERMTLEQFQEGMHYPKMNGKVVFQHAVKKMAETLTAICQKNQVNIDDIDVFLFHQANIRINQKVAEILGLDEKKVFNTIQDYGNTTAATIPLGMDKALEAGVLKPGMLVGSAAFGSGFTWASALWRM